MKIGDEVRFLNEVGGGKVVAFRDKNVVLVKDGDGFEIPMLINEVVVVESDSYDRKFNAAKAEKPVAPRSPKPCGVKRRPTYRRPQADSMRNAARGRSLTYTWLSCRSIPRIW